MPAGRAMRHSVAPVESLDDLAPENRYPVIAPNNGRSRRCVTAFTKQPWIKSQKSQQQNSVSPPVLMLDRALS